MKTMKALFHKEIWMKGILGMAACLTIFALSGFVSEAAQGTVKADTAKIRAQADTSSEVVGSTVKGKVIDIVGVVTDSSGMKWYKVPIANNGYGYIRSDLVETAETIEIYEDDVANAQPVTTTTEKPAETVPTSIGEQQATISQASVRIRSGASTQHDAVASLPQGTTITLIGEANDSAGNKWYQMTCNYNNKNIEGYVRSDLITIGAAASEPQNTDGSENTEGTSSEGGEGENTGAEGENTEGENPGEGGQESEPEQQPVPEHNDYAVVYNEDVYWLYDNTNGTMMKVADLLGVVNKANENSAALQNQVKNGKIVIIILAAIVVILVVVITVLLFKIRDLYYGDYEDDEDYEDEEEEIEEPVIVKKKKRVAAVEEIPEEPVRKKKVVSQKNSEEGVKTVREKTVKTVKERPVKDVKERPVKPAAEEAEIQAAERKQPAKKPSGRKAQNFLLDDDEFEFEFLNMDDKDL
ncbi:MAG: SH3 domain-containing protein [Lachnospiraceae bacterium]|nr:SH3 domain-containing protein [Lachnospiraceae bacterium]